MGVIGTEDEASQACFTPGIFATSRKEGVIARSRHPSCGSGNAAVLSRSSCGRIGSVTTWRRRRPPCPSHSAASAARHRVPLVATTVGIRKRENQRFR